MSNIGASIIETIWNSDNFFTKEFLKYKFTLDDDEFNALIALLIDNNVIIELNHDEYSLKETATIFPEKIKNDVIPMINNLFSGHEKTKRTDATAEIDWEALYNIEKFGIYPGIERIYEIHINKKVIHLEGEEILDYQKFRQKFFENFGVLLPVYKGINSDWTALVNYWYKNKGEIHEDKCENQSDENEAGEMIINYINNSNIIDDYSLTEGTITLKEKNIFISTRVIKKLLKRNGLDKISMRKLSYILKEYLSSGSIPLKIDNKSERFWRFKADKFELNDTRKIKTEKESDVEENA